MSERHAEPGCAICGDAMDEKYKPFCSKRCADVDLNRWLSGSYAIPGEPVPLSGDDNDEDLT